MAFADFFSYAGEDYTKAWTPGSRGPGSTFKSVCHNQLKMTLRL